MGSLALAAAGAVGGLGQGITEVGQQEQKKQMMQKESDIAQARQETIARLQDKFQKENIAGQQAFQKGQTETELHARGAVAAAEMKQKGEIAATHEAEATKRTKLTGQYRVEARQAGAPAAKPEKTWTPGQYQIGGGIDPVTHMPVPSTTIPVMRHKDGRIFVQAGNKMMLYNVNKDTTLPDSKGVRNADPKAVQDLTNDPEGRVPDGSETKADAFERAYGYLPTQYFSALQRAGSNRGAPGGPLGKNAPPNSTFVPGQPFGGGNAAGGAQDTEDDVEDEQGDDPYGKNGPPTSAPEDTMPAQ